MCGLCVPAGEAVTTASANPIDLAAERARRSPTYDGLLCECGHAWWRARVTISDHGYITGFAVEDIACASCGEVVDVQPVGVV